MQDMDDSPKLVDQENPAVWRIGELNSVLCDDRIVFEAKACSIPSPFRYRGVGEQFKSKEVIGFDGEVTTARAEATNGRARLDLTISRVADAMAVDRNLSFLSLVGV